jgi:HD-GYP domain-containing protein (c-di-GMP phosphodiesterase class II)
MYNPVFSFRDLLLLVDSAFGLMNEETNRHHHMVSYLTYRLAQASGLSEPMQQITVQAAYLHDIGGAIQGSRVSLADIEASAVRVSQLGADLLEGFPAFMALAAIVRQSQTPYRDSLKLKLPSIKLPGLKLRPLLTGGDSQFTPAQITLSDPITAAQLIHLADSVSLMVQPDIPVLNQVQDIVFCAKQASGNEFSPLAVSALEKLAQQEQIWLELAYNPKHILEELSADRTVGLNVAVQITKIISTVIDFRSPFTAMHSAGVAASAAALARLCGMDEQECTMMELAGNLHDLGKIRTPAEILEKPGKLTNEEFNVIKEHAYFTDVLLQRVRGFEQIGKWAALHHEKLNGKGYPYHLKGDEIPLGARIMAVADVFSAITEDRPYRRGMEPDKVKAILLENAQRGELSAQIVNLLIDNYDEVNQLRDAASHEAGGRYFCSIQSSGESTSQT